MLRSRTSIIILTLAFAFLSSCANRYIAATLNDVETYIQDHPDSALATIRAIDTTILTTRCLRAHYALLHAIALDKNWIDTTDVNIVLPAVEYYDRHPSGIRRAKAWYYLGRIQENGADFTSANISFLKAEKWTENESDEYFKSLIYQSLSNTFSKTYLNEEALKYSILSFDTSSRIGDTLGMNASRYRIAQDLNNLNRYHEADSLYQILLSSKGVSISPHLYPAILSDYALLRLQQYGDYLSAVNLFEEALKDIGYLRTPNHWGAYAYALLRTGNQGKAEVVFSQLEATDNNNALTYKTWRSRADAFMGNYAPAYDRIVLASEIQQMNVVKVLKQSTFKAQMDYQKQEKEFTRHRVIRRNLLFSAFNLLILSVAAGIIVYLRKRNLRITSERESMLESFRALSTNFATKSRDHAIIHAKYIEMFKAHIGQTGQIHYLLRHSTKDRDTHLYRELKKAIEDIRADEESQQQFEKHLNDSLNNVMAHFRDAFPGRKPRYYQLASYLFAGFDATIISNIIQGLSKDNVYVEKWRLKKDIRESNCVYKEQFLELLL